MSILQVAVSSAQSSCALGCAGAMRSWFVFLHPTHKVEAIGDTLKSEQQGRDDNCVFASDGVSVRVARFFLFHVIKRTSRIYLSATEWASEFRFQRTKIK
jgi:hypothetical protein